MRTAAAVQRFPVFDPATGDLLEHVLDATPQHALEALAAADRAQASWAAVAPRHRATVLHELAAAMAAHRDELAELIHCETGKPPGEAAAEVSYARDYVTWYAEEAVRVAGRFRHGTESGRILTTVAPVGPCLLITPWNFPLAMATRKIAPALAAGCTVIVKPAEQSPLSTTALSDLMREAGVPNGVASIVTTTQPAEVTAALLADPRLRKLSFTGSTAVGRRLLAQASERVLRTSMELGGDAPFIVFADADLDAAVRGALTAKLRNAGQACTAANRFLVQRPVLDELTRRLAGAMAACPIGPLIDEDARRNVHRLVEDAVARGARCHTGGHVRSGKGCFYEPTVLSDVPRDAAIVGKEIFGPVAVVSTFEDEREAITAANRSEMGLAAYVYRGDLASAMATAEKLDVGMVAINKGHLADAAAPFGGVKASGLGREGGREGIEEYLETRYYSFELPEVTACA